MRQISLFSVSATIAATMFVVGAVIWDFNPNAGLTLWAIGGGFAVVTLVTAWRSSRLT